jgi:hypothetical protein
MRKTHRKTAKRKLKGGAIGGFTDSKGENIIGENIIGGNRFVMIGYIDTNVNFQTNGKFYRYIPTIFARPVIIPNYFYTHMPEDIFPNFNSTEYFSVQKHILHSYYPTGKGEIILYLNIIYELGFRGLNFKEMLRYCLFLDENGFSVLGHERQRDTLIYVANQAGFNPIDQKFSDYKLIIDLENKYPGLFTRVFTDEIYVNFDRMLHARQRR